MLFYGCNACNPLAQKAPIAKRHRLLQQKRDDAKGCLIDLGRKSVRPSRQPLQIRE